MKIFILVLLIIILIADVLFSADALLNISYLINNDILMPDDLTAVILCLGCTAVTIAEIIRLKQKKKHIIIPMLCMKADVSLLCIAYYLFADGFYGIGIIILAVVLCAAAMRNNAKDSKNKKLVFTDISVDTEYGEFKGSYTEKDGVLYYDSFSGCVEWCGEECGVYLQTEDSHSPDISKSLDVLKRLLADAENWDRKLKEFSAEQKTDDNDGLIHIWGGCFRSDKENDDETVTKEEYISRMSLGFMDISADGELYFDFSLDDMFTDHGEAICADISGEILSCGLVG